ncbi:MAG: hypothetical protein GEU95_00820 [Rhizobiales bacterium]|nr:hypothetical protein [Hyphomicrobiales bacterium]
MNRPMAAAVSIAERFADHQASFELAHIARALVIAGGRWGDAAVVAEKLHAADRAQRILKSAVAGGTSDITGLTGDFRSASSAFLSALKNIGVLEAVLSQARVVPPQTFVSAVTIALEGSETVESKGKVLSRLELTPATLAKHKAIALVVMTADALREAGPAGLNFVNSELRNAVVGASDAIFLDSVTNGLTPLTGSATPSTDIIALLNATNLSSTSRIILVTPPAGVNSLLMTQASLSPSSLNTNGGTFAGITVRVTDALPGGTVVMIDASGIIAADEGLTLDTARHANLQFDDATSQASDSPPAPTTTVGLWQTNSVALRAERHWRHVARANSVAIMSGSTWATAA